MKHSEFVSYFESFYGPAGLYPDMITGYTTEQVLSGIAMRGTQFEGDSFDRESIRDMILVAQNKMGGVFDLNLKSPVRVLK